MTQRQPQALARLGVLGALFFLIAFLPLIAGWLNSWSAFAFPLGTLTVALIVPVAMIFLLARAVAHLDASDDAP